MDGDVVVGAIAAIIAAELNNVAMYEDPRSESLARAHNIQTLSAHIFC